MTSTSQSDKEEEPLLHALYSLSRLAPEEREELQRLAGPGKRITAIVDSDLLASGHFGRSCLLLSDEEIIVIENGSVQERIRLEEVSSAQSVDFVGNGQFQLNMKDGRRVDVIRYSKSLANAFEDMARRVNKKLRVSDDELAQREEEVARISGPKEERPTYRCPNCGHPLAHAMNVCPKCTSKRIVMGRLLGFLFVHRFPFLLGTVLSIVVIGINLAPAYLVRLLIDNVLQPTDLSLSVRISRLYVLVGFFLVLIIVRMIGQHYRIKIMGKLSARVILDLRGKLYRSLQRLSLSYYDREHTGRIMARVLNDTRGVQQFLVGGVQQIIMDGLTVIAIPIILFAENITLATVALLPIPVAVFTSRFFAKRFHTIFRTLRRRFANLSAQVSETISGIRVVKSFTQEEREVYGFDAKSREVYDAQISSVQTRAIFKPSVMFVMTLGTIVIWLIGGRQVIAGILTLGVLVQFITYMNQFYNPVRMLLQLTETFEDCAAAAERIFSIMDTPSEVADHENAVEIKHITGRIVFENVSFKYGSGNNVLKNINLTVEPGQMIGLAGRTGSGKTTLVSLICRFYDPARGRITLDGVDLRDIRVKSLRSHIGMVLQETFLFAETIKENISYGRADATDMEIIRAAKIANAHDFIMGFPDAYDTMVGERGVGLSVGEKQRIAIARVILKDPAILILDEATSSVDTATEQSIQEAMDRLVRGRTTFAIAHRLSTLRNVDRLLVMDDGVVIEEGTHAELMAMDGEYANLISIQDKFAKVPVAA